MLRTSLALAIVIQLLGCVSREAIPYCSPDDLRVAVPGISCSSRPEASLQETRLAEIIVPAAGSSRVHVQLDADSNVQAICAERGSGSRSWKARAEIATRRDEVQALPPGPPCLAGTRLVLNRLGARWGEVDSIITRCQRDASHSLDTGLKASIVGRRARACVHRAQVNRGELWVFDSRQAAPWIFVASTPTANRQGAIRDCATRDRSIGRSIFVETFAAAWVDAEVISCLESHGWKPFE